VVLTSEQEGTVDSYDLKFMFRYLTYVYDAEENTFLPIKYYFSKSFSDLHALSNGISTEDHPKLIEKYGNCTMEVKMGSWYIILAQDILNLYYIFQMFSVIVWFCNGYYRSSGIVRKFMLKLTSFSGHTNNSSSFGIERHYGQ